MDRTRRSSAPGRARNGIFGKRQPGKAGTDLRPAPASSPASAGAGRCGKGPPLAPPRYLRAGGTRCPRGVPAPRDGAKALPSLEGLRSPGEGGSHPRLPWNGSGAIAGASPFGDTPVTLLKRQTGHEGPSWGSDPPRQAQNAGHDGPLCSGIRPAATRHTTPRSRGRRSEAQVGVPLPFWGAVAAQGEPGLGRGGDREVAGLLRPLAGRLGPPAGRAGVPPLGRAGRETAGRQAASTPNFNETNKLIS